MRHPRFPNVFPRIDVRNTKWGSSDLCNYVHFSILTAGIFAFIWGAFFAIAGRSGSGKETDQYVLFIQEEACGYLNFF